MSSIYRSRLGHNKLSVVLWGIGIDLRRDGRRRSLRWGDEIRAESRTVTGQDGGKTSQ